MVKGHLTVVVYMGTVLFPIQYTAVVVLNKTVLNMSDRECEVQLNRMIY